MRRITVRLDVALEAPGDPEEGYDAGVYAQQLAEEIEFMIPRVLGEELDGSDAADVKRVAVASASEQ